MHTSSPELLTSDQAQTIVQSILDKVGEAGKSDERISIITLAALKNLLDQNESAVIDAIYELDPKQYGFKAPWLGLEPVPDNLVRVAPHKFRRDGKVTSTVAEFLPDPTYEAYTKMAGAIQTDLGRPLLIESSYRSDAYQSITFLSILKLNDFDLPKTAQRAAVPGYSEHSTPSSLALDLVNIDGLPSDETPTDFEGTTEYDWLCLNAKRFGFFMSYPKDSPNGVMFEPWHWRHKP